MADKISGVVTLDGVPTQARVTLLNSISGSVIAQQQSNAVTGGWEFNSVAAGTYEVLIAKDGYKPRMDGPWTLDGTSNRDVYYANVVSLLHFNGLDESAVFSDERGRTWTANGAVLDTALKKFGSASGDFHATGRITTPSSSAFDWKAEPFTIELWAYIEAYGGDGFDRPLMVGQGIDTPGNYDWGLGPNSAGKLTFFYWGGSVINFTGATTLPLNQFVHLAMTFDGSSVRLFVNGALDGTFAYSTAAQPLANMEFRVGFNDARRCKFYADDLRVTKGIARYIVSFPVPTKEFPHVGADPSWNSVASLVHLDGADGAAVFVDEVPGRSWSRPSGGAAITTSQSRFGGASANLTNVGVNGGILSGASPAYTFGTGDFCVEYWHKQDVSLHNNEARIHIDGRTGSNGPYFTLYNVGGTTVLRLHINGADAIFANALTNNTWQHIAVDRRSGVTRLFVDGIMRGSFNDSTDYAQTTFRIGQTSLGGADNRLDGYIDELRVTSGASRYAADFTPLNIPFSKSPTFEEMMLALLPWGYWKLDEASVGAAADSSGNGRAGTYAGTGTTFGEASLFGGSRKAVKLDGNGRINLPSFGSLNGQKMTCLVCFKTTGTGFQHLMSGDDNNGNRRVWQWRLNGGRMELVLWSTASVVSSIGDVVNDGNPHMAVLVLDPSLPAGQGKVKVYCDGVLKYASTTDTGITSSDASRPAIGSRSSELTAESMVGSFDDCAVWLGVALSAKQIAALWAYRNA